MKKVFTFGIIIALFIFYCYSRNNFSVSDLKPSTIVIDQNNINAIIKEDIISSPKENITLVLENKTQYEYYYGEYFNLEIELDIVWYEMPFNKNFDFKDLAIILKKNSKITNVINLSKYFTNLPQGKYRIVKSLYFNGKETIVAAIFEIKN